MLKTHLDAELVRESMGVYHDLLTQHRQRLNRLNVFPVPDADTGTNMALTVQSVIDGLEGVRSDEVPAAIVRGSLLGAQGSSGVILAQLLGAIARRFETVDSFDGPAMALALNDAAAAGYEAVVQPVEGTILTVARAAAEAAEATGDASLVDVLNAARDGADDALASTPDLLPALGSAGVVDAGGAGYVLLFDALLNVVAGVELPEPVIVEPEPTAPGVHHPRFEVVVQLAAPEEGIGAFRSAWAALGNESTVIVEGDGRWVGHLHTDVPDAAVEAARATGRVLHVQVTDLVAQVTESRNP